MAEVYSHSVITVPISRIDVASLLQLSQIGIRIDNGKDRITVTAIVQIKSTFVLLGLA